MITNNLYLKGIELKLNIESKIINKLLKYDEHKYYLLFNDLINLELLRENILVGILGGENKKVSFRYKYNKIKTVKLLSWNIHYNLLTYYDPKGNYTLQISRSGVKIFPNSKDYNLNLNLALDFILTLEKANFIEVI